MFVGHRLAVASLVFIFPNVNFADFLWRKNKVHIFTTGPTQRHNSNCWHGLLIEQKHITCFDTFGFMIYLIYTFLQTVVVVWPHQVRTNTCLVLTYYTRGLRHSKWMQLSFRHENPAFIDSHTDVNQFAKYAKLSQLFNWTGNSSHNFMCFLIRL